MADVTRLLSSRELDSIDDMNAFLQQAMASGAPPGAPLEQAQDRMYEGPDRARGFAKQHRGQGRAHTAHTAPY